MPYAGWRARSKVPDLRNLGRLLRISEVWSKNDADREHDQEPDPPHGHLSGMAGGSLADDG